MKLVVTRLTHEAQDVLGLELRSKDGSELPAFTAGAHVDLHLPGNICRQYSLCNSADERDRYVLGVGLAPESRGGSSFVHNKLAEGDELEVSEPRALFGIDPSASEHVFIAGGIGITPIMSMVRWCIANDKPWKLLYCVRSRARAAYAWTLAPYGERVKLHADQESATPADLAGWIGSAGPGAHVYCCGPEGLMNAVASVAEQAGIPKAAAHSERFAPPKAKATDEEAPAGSFSVTLKRSGQIILVKAEQSMLEALEDAGQCIPHSCREGMCRSCELPLLEGEADHRDYVLSDEERAAHTCILPCVSRARGQAIVVDL